MNIEFKLANKHDVKKLIEVQSKSFYEDYIKYGEYVHSEVLTMFQYRKQK